MIVLLKYVIISFWTKSIFDLLSNRYILHQMILGRFYFVYMKINILNRQFDNNKLIGFVKL